MNDFVRIDKSIARGLFNQEIRNGQDLLLGRSDTFKPDGRDLEHSFLMETISRMKGKPAFPVASFKPIARALAAYRLSTCEEIFGVLARTVGGSAQKSFVEASFRRRPAFSEDILASTSCYAFLKKDRLVMARRAFPIVAKGHAIRRYLQRGSDIQIGVSVLAPVLAEIYARSGLFLFLANIAGRHHGVRVAVPFKEGFLLCEIVHSTTGAEIDYFLPAGYEDGIFEETGGVKAHVHPLHWGSDPETRMMVVVNTFVGRREMKEGQADLHDLLEGVYQRTKKEIDLFGKLDSSFYPSHRPDLEQALETAGPRLDVATKDISAALSWSHRMSFAFTKEEEFDAAAVDAPSKMLKLARKGSDWTAGLAAVSGVASRGGGPFCHRPGLGLYEPSEGLGHRSVADVMFAFGLDPYGDAPDPAVSRILKHF